MKSKIQYTVSSRYSETMDDDKYGRWGRTIKAGNPNPQSLKGLREIYDIAHITKLKIPKNRDFSTDPKTWEFKNKFIVKYNFPNLNYYTTNTLKEAIVRVKKDFNKFIKDITKEYNNQNKKK